MAELTSILLFYTLATADISRKHYKAILAKLDHDKAASRIHECRDAIFVRAEIWYSTRPVIIKLAEFSSGASHTVIAQRWLHA